MVNAGSSSLKLSLVGADEQLLAQQTLTTPRGRIDAAALAGALASPLRDADAVGHRIVHGGARFQGPVRIEPEVERALRELVDLAPLHQPKSLAALDGVAQALPELPAVACFDTAFHCSMPTAASTYALPAGWRERWPLRRFGFHGLSHGWVARRAPQLLERDGAALRIVSCHLGAGASLCAIRDGRSLDTTMGFTPLEGLVMATRSGSVDPGMLLWLIEHERLTPAQLGDALEHHSGLVGLAGSEDMRELVARAGREEDAAELALAVYLHRLRFHIGAMAASLSGLDVLVFTGGVGEHSAHVRAGATAGLGFLGVELDESLNAAASGDAEIGRAGAPARTLVLGAREDLEIARQTRAVLEGPRP